MFSISVIVCTKNRNLDLINCIDSLMIQTYPISELIIIDSGDQGLDNIIDKYKLNIKYLNYKAGLTAARNRGIKESKSDIIIFLDDDVILDGGYIYNIISIFKNYGKEVGAVCGDIISDNMRSKRFPNFIKYSFIKKIRKLSFKIFFLIAWGDGKFQPSGFPTFPIGKKEILFIECLQGANMAFRREVLAKFKFDEKLQGYCFMEDCDISYRVTREYKIIYSPYAKLIHNISSVSRDSEFLRMKMFLENHYYLFKKNFPQKSYNKFAFWISVLGLFFISFLGMHIDEIKGLYSGLKSINQKGGL